MTFPDCPRHSHRMLSFLFLCFSSYISSLWLASSALVLYTPNICSMGITGKVGSVRFSDFCQICIPAVFLPSHQQHTSRQSVKPGMRKQERGVCGDMATSGIGDFSQRRLQAQGGDWKDAGSSDFREAKQQDSSNQFLWNIFKAIYCHHSHTIFSFQFLLVLIFFLRNWNV